MLELRITCEDAAEGQMYLNAPNYLYLISDLHNALRNARKHGTSTDVLKVFDAFMPELAKATDYHTGAY